MKVSIGKAARELGVSPETLRRWEAAGKIRPERTPGGHRRYDLATLYGLVPRHPQPEEPGGDAAAEGGGRCDLP